MASFDREVMNEGPDARIQFIYTETNYQEIKNTMGFNLESFVSGIGGFVGIFLGYSTLQLPELLEIVPSFTAKFIAYARSLAHV